MSKPSPIPEEFEDFLLDRLIPAVDKSGDELSDAVGEGVAMFRRACEERDENARSEEIEREGRVREFQRAERVNADNRRINLLLIEASAERDKLRAEIDDALAVVRAPDSTNDGGPANLAGEMRRLVDNNNALSFEVAEKAETIERERAERIKRGESLRAEVDSIAADYQLETRRAVVAEAEVERLKKKGVC